MSQQDPTTSSVTVSGRKSKLPPIAIGDRFGRWTVTGEMTRERGPKGDPYYLFPCVCDCGTRKSVDRLSLRSGASRSCGCLRAELGHERWYRHGTEPKRLYACWNHMIARCESPNATHYEYYGGRGISVCPEWRSSFIAFRDWAMANGYRDDLTIERKRVNGDYEPDNCEWIPQADQVWNKRTTRFVEAFGEVRPLGLWARDERCTVTYGTLSNRLRRGWTPEDAIATPNLPPGPKPKTAKCKFDINE
jgi:hypothetical protein